MTKIIDSIVQASLDTGNYPGVLLAKLYFSPAQRFCSANQTIYWDEAGSGEEAYIGLGDLSNVSVLNETSDLGATTIQLSLSGIPNSAISDVFSDEYIGKPVYLWYATLDPDTYAVQFDTNESDGPVLIFAGSMDYGIIEFGETATITVNATSRLADWDRPRGGRFNNAYQQRHIDATDLGFEHMIGIQDIVLNWGGITVLDPGNPGIPGIPGVGGGRQVEDK